MVKLIDVEVAFANPEQPLIIQLKVAKGSSVQQVIKLSGIAKQVADIDLTSLKVGVFSQLCGLDKIVEQDDRVEIYRPLQHHPMEARRKRAEMKKTVFSF